MSNILKIPKLVVFDMDETLGYFVEFGIFWKLLYNYLNKNKLVNIEKQILFNNVIELYPEIIRPNILSILYYLKYKVLSKECQGIMIYTNNQESKEWVYLIKTYFETKVRCNLFNNIICAFKINNEIVDLRRTTHDKTYTDFINCINCINCTKIDKNIKLCFIDDTYYPNMENENMYYIKIKPYTYNLSFSKILDRFINSNICKKIIYEEQQFITTMNENILNYQFIHVEKLKKDYEIDKIITKKIMLHLQYFFNKYK